MILFSEISKRLSCVLGTVLFCWGVSSPGADRRVRLVPKYTPGTTLRYRIDSRSTTSGKITTPILNPEGATGSTLNVHQQIRLDVLDSAGANGKPATRLRATYEKSSADSQSDALDPAQVSPSAVYRRLEGRSVEFTLDPDGRIENPKGVENVFPDRAAAQSALSWFSEVSSSSAFPVTGIEVGQKWKSERPMEGTPLADLISRAEYTYLRDEPCREEMDATSAPSQATSRQGTCAVILTRIVIFRRGAPRSEATPEDYLRNGLRVSGSWTGSGESLDSISLSTGFLVRSTETSNEQMDYEITSAATGSKIHNQIHVQAESEIGLISAVPVAAGHE